jgi:hypothetical protein
MVTSRRTSISVQQRASGGVCTADSRLSRAWPVIPVRGQPRIILHVGLELGPSGVPGPGEADEVVHAQPCVRRRGHAGIDRRPGSFGFASEPLALDGREPLRRQWPNWRSPSARRCDCVHASGFSSPRIETLRHDGGLHPRDCIVQQFGRRGIGAEEPVLPVGPDPAATGNVHPVAASEGDE